MLFAPVQAVLAQSATFVISDLNAAQFPNVSFQVRASAGASAADAAKTWSIFENGQAVDAGSLQVSAGTTAPAHVIVVLDSGSGASASVTELASLRRWLGGLLEGPLFLDGQDQLSVLQRQHMALDRTEMLLKPTRSRAEAAAWLARAELGARSTQPTSGLEAVRDALREARAQLPVQDSAPLLIVLVSAGIETPKPDVAEIAARNLAQDARAQAVIVHTLRTSASQSPALAALAEGSGGRAWTLAELAGDAPDAAWRGLTAMRQRVTIGYTSRQFMGGERTVMIGTPNAVMRGNHRFTVDVRTPEITLLAPQQGTVLRRELLSAQTGSPALPVVVRAEVTFPDGRPRSLNAAQLVVGGAVHAAAPTISGSLITFEADLAALAAGEPGSRQTTLQVRAQDAFGLAMESAPSQLRIETQRVSESRPPATTAPQTDPAGLTAWWWLPLIGLVLPLLLLCSGLWLWRRRMQVAQAHARALRQARQNDAGVLAHLRVLEGPRELADALLRLEKDRTVLGRNPESCDLVFFAGQESTISRRHCLLLHREGKFVVQDAGSRSGTRLNGRLLPPKIAFAIQEGDVLVLGDLDRRGVKLCFMAAAHGGRR